MDRAWRPADPDFDAYPAAHAVRLPLGLLMKPIFRRRKRHPKRIVYAEGEDERVLRAVQVVVDEGLAQADLIGRPAVIAQRIERYGLRISPGTTSRSINPGSTRAIAATGRVLPPDRAAGGHRAVRADRDAPPLTLIGAMMIHMGDADGMLCGTFGTHECTATTSTR
jgi:malate dehydrogenase (oxaloacetate-decarboxylating)(NADP+)